MRSSHAEPAGSSSSTALSDGDSLSKLRRRTEIAKLSPNASDCSEESEQEKENLSERSFGNYSEGEDDLLNGEDGGAELPGEDYEPPEVELPPDTEPYGGLKLGSDTESDEDFEVDTDSEQSSWEESEEDSPRIKKKRGKKRAKSVGPPAVATKLQMHVANTQYDVVRFVAKKKYNMRLTHADEDDWDLQWIDTNMTPDKLSHMQPYQKINHYPGMYGLARKNHLGRNLMKMKRILPHEYRFFPQTWLLPSEYNDFKAQFNKKKAKTFILKPEASSQGNGIFLTRNIEDVDPNEHLVAQRYMARPLLIEGLKFDLRIYVLVFGVDPLRIYMFNEGLTRFATELYQSPLQSNLKNLFMHLTNYAINKNNENFIFNDNADCDDVGHKRSLSFMWRYLRERGYDVQKLRGEIHDIIIKTLCSVQPMLAHVYRSCQPDDHDNSMAFEILGFDIMLDRNLKPYLIEVNHSPSFTADTPLDKKIKKTLVSDTIRLCNFSLKRKNRWKSKQKTELQRRVLTGKKEVITYEERERMRARRQEKRDQYELENLGNFTPIYLGKPHQKYDRCLEVALKIWEDFTGAKKPMLKGLAPPKPFPMRSVSSRPKLSQRNTPNKAVSRSQANTTPERIRKRMSQQGEQVPVKLQSSETIRLKKVVEERKAVEAGGEASPSPAVPSFYPPVESPCKSSMDTTTSPPKTSNSIIYKVSQQLKQKEQAPRLPKWGEVKDSSDMSSEHTLVSSFYPNKLPSTILAPTAVRRQSKTVSLNPPPTAGALPGGAAAHRMDTDASSSYFSQTAGGGGGATFYVMHGSMEKKIPMQGLATKNVLQRIAQEVNTHRQHMSATTNYATTKKGPLPFKNNGAYNHFQRGRYSQVPYSLKKRPPQSYWVSGASSVVGIASKITLKKDLKDQPRAPSLTVADKPQLHNGARNSYLLTPHQVAKAQGLGQLRLHHQQQKLGGGGGAGSRLEEKSMLPSGKFVVPKVLDFSPRQVAGGVRPAYMAYSLSRSKLQQPKKPSHNF